MRTLLSLVLPMTALLSGGGALRADEAAAAVVRKAIKAHGGEANLDKHMTCLIESHGTVELGPGHWADYTFKSELIARPGKFKQTIRIFETIYGFTEPYMSIHAAYNGDGQIVRNGKSEFLSDQALREFKAQAHEREVRLLTPLLRDKKFRLTVLDRAANVSGKAAVAIMVNHDDHQDIVLYFDKESGRLVKSRRSFYHIGKKREGEQVTFFSDFKTVEGALIPHRIVVHHDGREVAAERITNVRLLETAPDQWFRIRE